HDRTRRRGDDALRRRNVSLKILITGARGQLGYELAAALANLGTVVALDRAALDLANADSLARTFRALRPALIVNAAAYTAGERAIAASGAAAIVLRTSWVYSLRGSNFLLTIRRLAAQRDELRIVSDQQGIPNWARVLAHATATLVSNGMPHLVERAGLYHMSSSGQATWYEFARAIIGEQSKPRIVPIATSEYPTSAKRPAYGVL